MKDYTFSWRETSEHEQAGTGDDFDHFLSWMLPALIADDLFDVQAISDATENLTKCTLTIQLNGKEVDAESFLRGVRRNMEYWAEREAKRMLISARGLNKTHQLLLELDDTIKQRIRASATEAGLQIEEDDWYDYS